MSRKNIRRSIASLISISIIYLAILALPYTILNKQGCCETCSKDNICAVCIHIKQLQESFRTLGSPKESIMSYLILIWTTLIMWHYFDLPKRITTPVILKVRMDN